MTNSKKTNIGLLIMGLGLMCSTLSLTLLDDSSFQLPAAILAVVIILIGLFITVKKVTK